jgi:hypothetical protein
MKPIPIEQAIYGGQGAGGYRFLARSPGFLDEWLSEAQRLCTAFGERPTGAACPACVFAQPFLKQHVAVIQVADHGADSAGRLGTLGFRLLVLPRTGYLDLGGDPFLIAERFPPPWHVRGELPGLFWPAEPPRPRTVEQVQRVLKREADGPSLLGGSQVLVDGGRLVFERPAPDTELMHGLWTLLPTSTRSQLWPASFAFGNTLGFDAVVAPQPRGVEYAGYLTEEQAAEYPEGRYELHLQIAAEAGDQHDLDRLFARRSRGETWRLGLTLLILLLILVPVGNWLVPTPAPPSSAATSTELDLPPAEQFSKLNAEEEQQLTDALASLARQLGVKPQPTTADKLLTGIDDRLGTPENGRDPGSALTKGPIKRRLRALLWKQGVAEYRDHRLNPVELVERLQHKVSHKQDK